MAREFVWFSLGAEDPARTREFYSSLLDREIAQEGMVAGETRPWAALELGATVLRDRTRGPAGDYTTIADPTGAAIALWQPAVS